MNLLTIIVAIIVVGLVLWLVNTYLPLEVRIKQILNIVVIIVLVVWLLKATGVWAYLARITV